MHMRLRPSAPNYHLKSQVLSHLWTLWPAQTQPPGATLTPPKPRTPPGCRGSAAPRTPHSRRQPLALLRARCAAPAAPRSRALWTLGQAPPAAQQLGPQLLGPQLACSRRKPDCLQAALEAAPLRAAAQPRPRCCRRPGCWRRARQEAAPCQAAERPALQRRRRVGCSRTIAPAASLHQPAAEPAPPRRCALGRPRRARPAAPPRAARSAAPGACRRPRRCWPPAQRRTGAWRLRTPARASVHAGHAQPTERDTRQHARSARASQLKVHAARGSPARCRRRRSR